MWNAGRVGHAIAAGVAVIVLSQAIYAQSGGYQTINDFFKMPDGRKVGSTAGITIDPDGTSIFRVLAQLSGGATRGRLSADGASIGYNASPAEIGEAVQRLLG